MAISLRTDEEHDAFYERELLSQVDVKRRSNPQSDKTDKSRKPLTGSPCRFWVIDNNAVLDVVADDYRAGREEGYPRKST